jgi:cytochrome c peroxidase
VSEYAGLRTDAGHFAVTKQQDDFGAFRTPSLWEVGRTAPYMHNGSLPTLEHVIEFYDEGGGEGPGKDTRLKPLRLTAAEKADLADFLRSLSGTLSDPSTPVLPSYELRKLGEN